MTATHYNAAVRRRFLKAAFAGAPDERPGWVEARAEEGGDGCRLCLAARIVDGRVERLRYRVYGCPHLIAATDVACERLQGGAVARLRSPDLEKIRDELDVPVTKSGRLLLLEDAFMALAGKCDSAT